MSIGISHNPVEEASALVVEYHHKFDFTGFFTVTFKKAPAPEVTKSLTDRLPKEVKSGRAAAILPQDAVKHG